MTFSVKLIYAALFLALGMGAGHLVTVSFSKENTHPAKIEHSKKVPVGWFIHREPAFTIETDRTKRKELERIVSGMQKGNVPDDWEKTIEKLILLSNHDFDYEVENALCILFLKWSEHDFEAAMERAATMGMNAGRLKKEIFSRLAATNYKLALQYLEQHKEVLVNNEDYHSYVVQEIAKNWALHSPEEALEWCNSLKRNFYFNDCILVCLRSIELQNPGELKRYIDRVYAEKGSFPQNVLTEWAENNPQEAREWLTSGEGISNGNAYHNKQAIIRGVARVDLETAEELISQLPIKDQYGSVWEIALTMMNSVGVEEALTWQMKMCPDTTPDVSVWARNNPYEAREWLEKLPPTKGRDEAIAMYAGNVPSIDLYPEVLKFSESRINDQNIKTNTMEKVIKNWMEKNPEGMQQWVSGSDCPESLRYQVEKFISG